LKALAESLGYADWTQIASDVAYLVDSLGELDIVSNSVADIIAEVNGQIDKYTAESMSDYQKAIAEAEAWRETQLAALEIVTDFEYTSQYEALLKQIEEAFGLMLDDIQSQVEKAALSMEDSLLSRLYGLTMASDEYAKYQVEMQYQKDIADIRDLEKQTGKDFSNLIAIAEQIYEAEIDQIEADQVKEDTTWEAIGVGSSIVAIMRDWIARVNAIGRTSESTAILALNEDVNAMLLKMSELLATRWGTNWFGSTGWYEGDDKQLETNKEFLEKIKLLYIDQIEHIRDALIDAQQKIVDSWTSVIESIQDQIYGMQTSTDNPRDVEERLAFVKEQIEFTLGGQSVQDYLAQFESPAEQQAALAKLQEYYEDYLSLGQEAYQRPSAEYQEVYDYVLGQLQIMEELATSYKSEAELELERLTSIETTLEEIFGIGSEELKQWNRLNHMIEHITQLLDGSIEMNVPINVIPESVIPESIIPPAPELSWWEQVWQDLFPNYATGTSYVPETGPAYIHAGEQIIPTGYDYPEMQTNININVYESKNPKQTAREVRHELEGFMRSGIGRRLVQDVARGK